MKNVALVRTIITYRLSIAFIFLISLLHQLPVAAQHLFPSIPSLKSSTTNYTKYKNRTATILPSLRTNNEAACSTTTFYMNIPAPAGQKIEIKDAQTLPGGDFILAGNLLNNGTEGWLIRMSNEGNLVMQKRIMVNNKAVQVQAVKVTASGKIVIAGILPAANEVVMVAFNSDLSVNWSKVITLSAMPSKLSLELIEDQFVALAAQLPSSIVYIKLNISGGLVWINELSPPGLTELVGFGTMIYGHHSIIANCLVNGQKQVAIIAVNDTYGDVTYSNYLDSPDTELKAMESTAFADRRLIVSMAKTATGFELRRDILARPAESETRHRYQLPHTIDFSVSAAMDNAGDVMGFCFPNEGKLVFLKHFAYYQTTPEHTREYAVPQGSSISAVARSFDGGYLFTLNNSSLNNIVLIKTDSTGVLAGCNYNDLNLDTKESISAQNSPLFITKTLLGLPIADGQVVSSDLSLSRAFDCNQNYCPLPPVEDSCLSTYFKVFRSHSYIDLFGNYYLMENNRQLVTTTRYDRILGGSNQVTSGLKLLDEKGNFLKGAQVFLDGQSSSFSVRQMDDHSVMLVSYSVNNNIPRFTLTHVSADIQILWSKSFETWLNYDFASAGYGYSDLHQDKEGNFYFVGTRMGFYSTKPGVLVYKMDPSGNPVWLKAYEFDKGLFGTAKMASTSSSLIIIIEGGNEGNVSARLDKNTGQMLNAYQYKSTWDGSIYDRLAAYDGKHIVYAGGSSQSKLSLSLFDTTGYPLQLKYLDHEASIPRAAIFKNGNLYVNYTYFDGSAFKDVLLKTDGDLNPQFSNEFDKIRWGNAVGMGVSDNENIYIGGNYQHGSDAGPNYFDPYIIKYNSEGEPGTCNFNPIALPFVSVDLYPVQLGFAPVQRSFKPVTIPIAFVDDNDGPQLSEILCSSLPQCNFLKIKGPAQLCHTNEPTVFQVTKNAGCTLIPRWLVDTAAVQWLSATDTSVSFRFNKAGTFWIKGKLDAGCQLYEDSLEVNVYTTPASLDLGRDTVLCPGNTLLLNARKGYVSYLWKNGSSDSVFSVTQPGEYYVTVRDACGTTVRDTVIVRAAPPVPFNIGPDRTKCNSDTLHLNAPPGFFNYTWSNNYQISSATAQNVVVNPLSDTAYFVKAEKTPGCFAYDTIRIKVFHSAVIKLGTDTSFCEGNSLRFDAGSGFTAYQWSNGASTQKVTVSIAGIYSVIGTTLDGCRSYDTLNVKTVFKNPVVRLDHDSTLCSGTSRRLDAGNFAFYQWNNGSTSKSITINSPGLFAVMVTDNNGCRGTDTTEIATLLPVPTNFLPADTSICSYGSLTLKVTGSYNSYLWNNNAATSSITISSEGTYWLQVRDANNCVGRDTVVVRTKNCMEGIYVPTAFTPNKDGKNDLFRPLLFGNVKSFLFTIYNRWGQVVFQTTELQKGWDGNYAGITQDSNMFLWTCMYQMEGHEKKMDKGSVVLIR
jgi:gliding motility-associated-like protein